MSFTTSTLLFACKRTAQWPGKAWFLPYSIAPAASAQKHSLAQWEARRERFTYLYLVEDRTLSEVKETMATQYGFRAIERRYKRKITAWKLDNNIKDSDMKVMVRKQLKRKLDDGKESEFQLHGRAVRPQEMSRSVQRKRLTHEEILAEQMPTPSSISCHTPAALQDEQSPGQDVSITSNLSSRSLLSSVYSNSPKFSSFTRMATNSSQPSSPNSSIKTISQHGESPNFPPYLAEGTVPQIAKENTLSPSQGMASPVDSPSRDKDTGPSCGELAGFAAKMTLLLCFDS
ncbi:uncharacterized protein PAC_16341 [Phialocephala subalpina]|uniref:Clr5 domain-containing protein n=1 Tax=Phialocephala subalpina TaxID=576137 RepID=A0A1L7XN01_9HELO|nr:uncharacterized protein PAC_16341 [Phialocephala subalpina]